MRTGKPSYRARLMEKKTSAVSLSRLRVVVAERSSRSSSKSRARYQDGGDWRGRERTACHLLRRRWRRESRAVRVGWRIVCRVFGGWPKCLSASRGSWGRFVELLESVRVQDRTVYTLLDGYLGAQGEKGLGRRGHLHCELMTDCPPARCWW